MRFISIEQKPFLLSFGYSPWFAIGFRTYPRWFNLVILGLNIVYTPRHINWSRPFTRQSWFGDRGFVNR